jgi:D(-)-tartrate dehydratase
MLKPWPGIPCFGMRKRVTHYPDLFQSYGGFPDGVKVHNGHITLPDLVGIGFEGKSDLYRVMKSPAN